MVALKASLAAFIPADDGATAIEYGLIGALLAVGCIAAMSTFGNSLFNLFNYVREESANAMDNAGI